MSKRFKYCLSAAACLVAIAVFSQQNNQGNQAVVIIVGDVPDNNSANYPHDFINSNPYTENNSPQQQELTTQNIEPTLENGFHVRFELNSVSKDSNKQNADVALISGISTTTSSSGGSASVGKSRKHLTSRAERSFNIKKRIRSKLPARKKRYHPHLCGRF